MAKLAICFIFDSPLGWIGIEQSDVGVRRIVFGHRTRSAAMERLQPAGGASGNVSRAENELASLILDYAHGTPISFDQVALDLPSMTPFQRQVTAWCRRIPFGQTMSYQQLAVRAGSPRAARAVGNVMARNPVPLVVPCHRVLGAGQSLGGFSAPGGIGLKRRLLELEGSSTA